MADLWKPIWRVVRLMAWLLLLTVSVIQHDAARAVLAGTFLLWTVIDEAADGIKAALLAERCPPSPPREDVTPSGVAALRMAADNMPLGRSGEPWRGAAEWLHRRADAIEKHLNPPASQTPEEGR